MDPAPSSSSGHKGRNGSTVLKLDPIQQAQPDADLDATIGQYERIATALSGFTAALSLQADVEKQSRQLHAYAKLLRATASYMLEVNGVVFELRPTQITRLEDTVDELDEVMDTLEWATDKQSDLVALLDENRAS